MSVERQVYSPMEFGVAYGLGKNEVYSQLKSGSLGSIRNGTRYIIPFVAAEEWVKKMLAERARELGVEWGNGE